MAAQRSASSSRASAKQAQRRAKRSESLSGSMRQFLTPEVWKQVKQAASQHGCRNGVRWTRGALGSGGLGVRPSFKLNLKLGLTPQRQRTPQRLCLPPSVNSLYA